MDSCFPHLRAARVYLFLDTFTGTEVKSIYGGGMNPVDLTTKHTQKADELSLLDRVVLILEQARANVVRAVNSNMVTAYWLIGREIVLDLQGRSEIQA
jgi:hypothetical protein